MPMLQQRVQSGLLQKEDQFENKQKTPIWKQTEVVNG